MCLKVMPTPTSTDRAGTGNMESSNERNPRDDSKVELVSKELNHFGMIAGLFRQIGGHISRFVLFCSF